MNGGWVRTDAERLKALRPRVDGEKATVEEIIECAMILSRLSPPEKSRDWEKHAIDVLRNGLRRFPNQPDLLHELAMKLRWHGKCEAHQLLRKAVREYKAQGRFDLADNAAKELADDFFYDGCDALDAKDHVHAERFFRKAIRLYPFHADSWGHLGIIHERRGNWLEAGRCYWRGLQLGRIACHEIESNDRRIARVTRSSKEARRSYWGQLGARPFLRALYNWAQLLYQKKDFHPALAYAQESLVANPNDNTGARDLIFSILRLLGKKSEMRRLARQYPGESLSYEADELEISCFGNRLSQPRKRSKAN